MATAPVAIVLINIPMATLRVLHQVVMPFYMCLFSVLLYGVYNIFNKDHFLPDDEEFEIHGRRLFWILTVLVNGVCYNLAWQFKILAYKSDRVTRVAPVFYVETALSMVLDIVLFHIHFSGLQLTGLILVLGMFLVIIVFAYMKEYKEEIEEETKSK